jgi:hypothetical protein
MSRRARLLALAVLSAVLAAPAGAQAQTPPATQGTRLVDLQRPTPLREYAGWLLFSRWDGSAYRLSTWHDGAVNDLAVPTQGKPFDADAGPDSAGRPSAVVSICGASCDLYVIGFDEGDQLRPVRNANSSDHDELAPSVWKGRLVFGRRYGPDEIIPYTKLLSAPRSQPSERLAGLPATRCGAVTPPSCRPIIGVGLSGLELWGRWVGQSWTYQPKDFPGFRQNEIRLTDVARTDTRQVAAMTTGLGGQTYLGPAFADGRLAFFRACQGDPGGCSDSVVAGAFRYGISSRAYDVSRANEAWSAWTYDGTAAYHVPSDYDCSGGDVGVPVEPCGIVRQTGLTFSPVAANRVR